MLACFNLNTEARLLPKRKLWRFFFIANMARQRTSDRYEVSKKISEEHSSTLTSQSSIFSLGQYLPVATRPSELVEYIQLQVEADKIHNIYYVVRLAINSTVTLNFMIATYIRAQCAQLITSMLESV